MIVAASRSIKTIMALTAVTTIAMTDMTTGAMIDAMRMTIATTAAVRRIVVASVWHRTIVATALPTTTSTISSHRRARTNGVAWITPTC